MDNQSIAVLGSTGSIGMSALDVIERHSEHYRVFALTAHRNIELLAEQCERFTPNYAVVADTAQLDAAREKIGNPQVRVLAGSEALSQVAADADCDTVLAGISGAIGLAPTLAAVSAGKRVLLANKEALIVSGRLLLREARASGAQLLPVDSEHSGVFQCLGQCLGQARDRSLEKVILTASGGPFLNAPREAFAAATPQQACAHPNWDMGAKISVDSATMMNKGLEVIEACRLFDLKPEQVEVLVHPQSIVHAMVAFKDGSVLAQLAQPDMRVPIALALAWPERIDSGVAALDLTQYGALQFQAADEQQFPCLSLAYAALRSSEAAVIALNAANEVAVAAFLAGRLRFDRIATVVRAVSESAPPRTADSLEEIIALDSAAREQARALLRNAPLSDTMVATGGA